MTTEIEVPRSRPIGHPNIYVHMSEQESVGHLLSVAAGVRGAAAGVSIQAALEDRACGNVSSSRRCSDALCALPRPHRAVRATAPVPAGCRVAQTTSARAGVRTPSARPAVRVRRALAARQAPLVIPAVESGSAADSHAPGPAHPVTSHTTSSIPRP